MNEHPDWISLTRGDAPLLVSLPHTGTEIPAEFEPALVSPWLARKDADWWIERLYDFAGALGATVVRTAISRTIIDVNRDPSGVSLYPGQATTELCPTTTFDGEPLYLSGMEPSADEIARRRSRFFDLYHATLRAEIERLRERHGTVGRRLDRIAHARKLAASRAVFVQLPPSFRGFVGAALPTVNRSCPAASPPHRTRRVALPAAR